MLTVAIGMQGPTLRGRAEVEKLVKREKNGNVVYEKTHEGREVTK